MFIILGSELFSIEHYNVIYFNSGNGEYVIEEKIEDGIKNEISNLITLPYLLKTYHFFKMTHKSIKIK